MTTMQFSAFVGPNFILMQDNVRPHMAEQMSEYLNVVNILGMVIKASRPQPYRTSMVLF